MAKKTKPADIARRLREQSQDKKKQIDQLREQLTITDAIIDEYDELINSLDPKTVPLTTEINTAIKAVETAYKARITAGCRSDLIWQLQETRKIRIAGIVLPQDTQTWKVVKDPAQYRDIGYYGVKYYRKPQNREYGANLVAEIPDANIDLNTKSLVVFNPTYGLLSGISTGDYITDDLEEPLIWPTGNLPTVVGVGTTSYPGIRTSFTGFCTASDNKIYSDQNVGILTIAKVGDYIYFEEGGIVQPNTKITGFGTAYATKTIIDINGITTSVIVTVDYATVTPILVGGGTSLTFTVGIVSTYDAVFLSTTPSVGAAHSSFLVIRPPDTTDVVFEATKNPIDPIEIGIVKEGSKTGRGHKIELINNKDPDVVRQWSEVRQEPEPAVGAGKAEYYVGAFSWPTITTCSGTPTPICVTNYAPEGTTVSIAVGSTIPQAQLGTTAVSPLSPPNCATLDANIAAAEATMNAKISANVPKINHYVNGAESVRGLRDEEETTAWSYLQGIAYLQDKQKSLNSKANQIDNFNWKDAGY
jgi:hypothetical protein